MIQALFFLTAIFTSWFGYPDTGYTEYTTYTSDDIEFDCKHSKATGCLIYKDGSLAIVIMDINMKASKGCTVQTHEFFHLMGYEEWDIPRCVENSQEFRGVNPQGMKFIG